MSYPSLFTHQKHMQLEYKGYIDAGLSDDRLLITYSIDNEPDNYNFDVISFDKCDELINLQCADIKTLSFNTAQITKGET